MLVNFSILLADNFHFFVEQVFRRPDVSDTDWESSVAQESRSDSAHSPHCLRCRFFSVITCQHVKYLFLRSWTERVFVHRSSDELRVANQHPRIVADHFRRSLWISDTLGSAPNPFAFWNFSRSFEPFRFWAQIDELIGIRIWSQKTRKDLFASPERSWPQNTGRRDSKTAIITSRYCCYETQEF